MQLEQVQSFASREEAGRKLAQRLAKYSITGNTIVLALPNGGVPVGAEIAGFLNKPFDVLLVERILAPGSDGAPLGALTGGGVRMLNSAMIDRLQLSKPEVNSAVLDGSMRLARREKRCRGKKAAIEIADRTVILIDDGTAPCEVIRAAVRLLRRQHADRVIVALPVACQDIVSDLRMEADHVVTLAEPKCPENAGNWYDLFPKTTDADVCQLLAGKSPVLGLAN
jgi:predicted phosphoribosyltransferase